MRKIRKGDSVVVIAGRDKGKRGDVEHRLHLNHDFVLSNLIRLPAGRATLANRQTAKGGGQFWTPSRIRVRRNRLGWAAAPMGCCSCLDVAAGKTAIMSVNRDLCNTRANQTGRQSDDLCLLDHAQHPPGLRLR
jgi:hypothetical protein